MRPCIKHSRGRLKGALVVGLFLNEQRAWSEKIETQSGSGEARSVGGGVGCAGRTGGFARPCQCVTWVL